MKKYKEIIIQRLSVIEIKDKWALLLISLSVIFFFSPLLFLGKILMSGDSTYGSYSLAYFFSNFPGVSINPFVFSGYPVISGFQFGYFNPIYNLFFRLFDFIFTVHFIVLIDYLGGAILTYLFTRKIGLSAYASIISSLAYTFSQYSITWQGLPHIANSVYLLPAIFYLLLYVIELNRKSVIFFGLILGISFSATHYQFIILACIGGGVFFIYEIWLSWAGHLSFFKNAKPFLFLFIGIVIAFVISLPSTLSSLSLFKESTRHIYIGYSSASYLDLFKYILPTWNLYHISLDVFRTYVGIGPFFLAVVGIYQLYRRKLNNKRAVFFAWFSVVTLIMSLKYSPSLLIIRYIPIIKYFSVESHWLYLSSFGLVVLAGFGFDFLINNSQTINIEVIRKFIRRITVFLLTAFTTANLIYFFCGEKIIISIQRYFDAHMYANTTQLSLDYYHDVIRLIAGQTFMNVSFLNINVVLLFIYLYVLYLLLKLIDRKILFSNLFIIFVLLNMLSFCFATLDIADKNLIIGRSNTAEFIHANEDDIYGYRVFGFATFLAQYQMISATHANTEIESLVFAREALIANANVYSEIPIVGGYDTLNFRRYQNIVTHLEDTTSKKTIEEKTSIFLSKLNLLSAFNVKYIVSPYILDNPNLDLVFSEKVTDFQVPLYLYKNMKFLPRFYLAKKVTFLSENDEEGNFSRVVQADSNFKDVTFIECDKCTNEKAFGQIGTVRLIFRDKSGFEIEVTSERDEWLVVSNESVPGWRASIDGVFTKIYYANHAFMGVFVPKGKHKVVFSYEVLPDVINIKKYYLNFFSK